MGATLNLPKGKTVKPFYTFSSPDDTHGQGLSNKKNRALYHACVLKYVAAKIRSFFLQRVILWAPTVVCTVVRWIGYLLVEKNWYFYMHRLAVN
jgi:hypothetical protein